MPLDRPVAPDEYQAISRLIASDLGIDLFDDTTYQAHRLMYWPSTAADAKFFFEYQDGAWINADECLARYDNWQDQSLWPVSSRTFDIIKREIKKQENPIDKPGIVGAFCRTYTVQDAIDKYLADVYEACAMDGRYTYTQGTSSAGAVVYEDLFLYSHHATDPCSMKLVNAFDLVRVHKFGAQDEDVEPGAPTAKLPSYTQMRRLAIADEAVKVLIGKEQLEEAGLEFDDESTDWLGSIKRDPKNGEILSTRYNVRLILQHDPQVKEKFAWDDFSKRIVLCDDLPWRPAERGKFWSDADDAALRYYLETYYDLDSVKKIDDEVINMANTLTFHKVREYLDGMNWDGENRIETMFIDYLGAEDTPYTRAVTRKMLVAAVGRVMQPGIKFDNMVVLVGKQGVGKSYLSKLLAKDWFSDSLTTVQGKEAYEQLRGVWIAELAELSILKKAEVEAIKQFISKQEDSYRVAYGKQISVFPRQCIFIGTTNDVTFLKDRTGNRRFWPVVVGVQKKTKNLWSDDIEQEIDQIWAEAREAWKAGESLYIGAEMEQEAMLVQTQHTEENPLFGLIKEYLEKELPQNWNDLDAAERRSFIRGDDFDTDLDGAIRRDRVCTIEIWVELLGGDLKRFPAADRRDINDVLRSLPGWRAYKEGESKLRFGSCYGVQRAYVRSKQ